MKETSAEQASTTSTPSRLATGVAGLDDILEGGFPTNRKPHGTSGGIAEVESTI